MNTELITYVVFVVAVYLIGYYMGRQGGYNRGFKDGVKFKDENC